MGADGAGLAAAVSNLAATLFIFVYFLKNRNMFCNKKSVLDIPPLYLYDSIAPLYGLMWVHPSVDLISRAVSFWFYKRNMTEEKSA